MQTTRVDSDPPTTDITLDRSVRAPLVGAAERLLARIDEVADVMLERIVAEEPAYQRLSDEQLEDVRRLVISNTEVLVDAMSGRPLKREQLNYVADHVRERVRFGISLGAVLQAYRTGLNVFWEEYTADVAALGLSRSASIDLARKMSEAMDVMTTHAAATYVREEAHMRAMDDNLARDLLDALIRGETATQDGHPHPAAPALDPQGDLMVVIGRVSTAAGGLASTLEIAAKQLADELTTAHSSPLVVVRDRAVVAVTASTGAVTPVARLTSARETLLMREEINLYCGVSSNSDGFGGVASAYEEATVAVSRASDRHPIVSLGDLPALQHLLMGATRSTRDRLVEKGHGVFEDSADSAQMLNETVTAFAGANMNVTDAAAELHIHQNTLRYRLRRIHERTGHDPQSFEGLLELICLLAVLDDRT